MFLSIKHKEFPFKHMGEEKRNYSFNFGYSYTVKSAKIGNILLNIVKPVQCLLKVRETPTNISYLPSMVLNYI